MPIIGDILKGDASEILVREGFIVKMSTVEVVVDNM